MFMLREQFGADYTDQKEFNRKLKNALLKVKKVYPGFTYDDTSNPGRLVTEALGISSVPGPIAGCMILLGVVVVLTVPSNKKIAFGKGWTDSRAILVSILMGINSIFCCGIVGYSIMQTVAANEMKRYGVRPSIFGGVTKKAFRTALANRRKAEEPLQPPSFMP